jgi:hypothetical protein
MEPSEYPDVRKWMARFQDGPDHVDYLWEHADLATWISASSLFWPQFVEVQGCVLWERVYEERNFADWYERLGADIPRVEGVLNRLNLWQVIPSRETQEDDLALMGVARCLRNCWEASLRVHFPAALTLRCPKLTMARSWVSARRDSDGEAAAAAADGMGVTRLLVSGLSSKWKPLKSGLVPGSAVRHTGCWKTARATGS